LNQSIAKESKP
jgi:EF-hand domain pair